MDDHEMDTQPAGRAAPRQSHPSSRYAKGRRSKGRQPSSPPPHPSSPHFGYSDDGSERGDMDVDDEIDELLSDEGRGGDGDDHGDDEDEDEGGDAGKTDGQRECLWEGCGEVLDDQADLVQHVQSGELDRHVWML